MLIMTAFFPTEVLDRVAYWLMFALTTLSIEKLSRNMNWNVLSIAPRLDKIITILTILGIAFLFLWIILHP
jgi:hypothetical protein